MSKKPTKTEDGFRPDPNRTHPPIDDKVKLPRQVRLAAARAEDLIAGKQPRPVEVTATTKSRSASKLPYSDAQIDAVLERWDQGNLKITDPEFSIIVELARECARLTKAHRRGAQKTRKTSKTVTKRLEALIQAFRELSPKLQAHPTGVPTIERLRKAIIQKLGLLDNDDVLSEDTIRQDIRQVRLLLRLVQKGQMPPPGRPRSKPELPERTRREMEAGRATSTRIAAANKSPEPREGPFEPSDDF
jgi:hypothetical protein